MNIVIGNYFTVCLAMADTKPYHATPDELRAIDAGLLDIGGPPIPDAELPAFYHRQAAQYRALADQAETVHMRILLLEAAERLDKFAAESAARVSS